MDTSNMDLMNPDPMIFAVGNEPEKLKYLIRRHVNYREVRIFADICKEVNMKEMTCAEVNSILEKLSMSEREHCCKSLIKIISADKDQSQELDEVITAVILSAYENGIIPLLLTCELLIISIDFKIFVPNTADKVKFVRSHMHELDYKGMRDLLKTLLVEKLDKLPSYLTEHQRRQLVPVEELMVDLIDRKKNFCPALFIITEISRISLTSPVHILPKVSLKIREVVASFRPLAEICTMIGRTWMYPITAHLCYHSQVSSWKLTDGKLHFKTHLPYSTENCAPQSYFQYILLKQPRGHENLNHFIRSVVPTVPPPKIQCNEIMQMLIFEAICAVEESEQPAEGMLNQYNWMNIVHLVVYALCHHSTSSYGSIDQLINMLVVQIRNKDTTKNKFTKSRGELFWLLLNFVSYAVTEKIQVNEADIREIFDIVYPDEPAWAGCSTDTLSMVRFFAPAAIWANLAKQVKSGDKPLNVPEKIIRYIDMIDVEKKPYVNEEFLAVVANAHPCDPSNPKFPHPLVQQSILKKLEAPIEDTSHIWTLPHGYKTDSHLFALELNLLDSLTFLAKSNILQFLMRHLKEVCASGRLPSPALIETLARIPFTAELNRLTSLIFNSFLSEIQIFGNTLTEMHNDPSKVTSINLNMIAILGQIIIYRFMGGPVMLSNKGIALKAAYDCMNLCCKATLPAQQTKLHLLYDLMEQIIMRIFIWTPPSELFHILGWWIQMIRPRGESNQGLNSNTNEIQKLAYAMKFNLLAPPEMFNRDYGQGFHVCPEISRIFLINLIRSFKIAYLGDSHIASDSLASLSQVHKFSESVRRWFPENLQHACKVDEGPNEELFNHFDTQSKTDCAMFTQWSQMPNQQMNSDNYWTDCANQYMTERMGQHTLLVAVFRYFFEFQRPPPPLVYKILSLLKIKDLILNVNAFVDYILFLCKQDRQANEKFMHIVNVIDRMVLELDYISFDRFFLALVMHPNDDLSIEFAMLIIHTLISNYPNFIQRIQFIVHYLPSHYSSATANSNEFFKNMSDYYNKFPKYTYEELYNKILYGNNPQVPFANSESHLPTYYGTLPERILPVVDMLLQRALELPVNERILNSLLVTFSPLYKFHPQPASFLYKTLYSLDSSDVNRSLSHTMLARSFVLEIVSKLEDREQKFTFLTASFMNDYHQLSSPVQICQQLVDRIIQASIYTHIPPSFVTKDWRFAEYPPAAQALTGAGIELMAGPNSPHVITRAFLELAMKKPINRPYDTINAIALILTTLPLSFQQIFLEEVETTIEYKSLVHSHPSIVFESFNQEVFLYTDNQILVMLALVHAYTQHGNAYSLSLLSEILDQRMSKKVKNEAQLMYFLRIVVPLLQRMSDKEKGKNIQDLSSQFLNLIVDIYEIIARIVENNIKLIYEDAICDLLYAFKYMFVGYAVKDKVNSMIERFPETMREKLKFLLTHGAATENPANISSTSTGGATSSNTSNIHQALNLTTSFPTNPGQGPSTSQSQVTDMDTTDGQLHSHVSSMSGPTSVDIPTSFMPTSSGISSMSGSMPPFSMSQGSMPMQQPPPAYNPTMMSSSGPPSDSSLPTTSVGFMPNQPGSFMGNYGPVSAHGPMPGPPGGPGPIPHSSALGSALAGNPNAPPMSMFQPSTQAAGMPPGYVQPGQMMPGGGPPPMYGGVPSGPMGPGGPGMGAFAGPPGMMPQGMQPRPGFGPGPMGGPPKI